MLEYCANILYAFVIRRFKTWLLALFVFASALMTLDLGLSLNMFGFMGDGEWAKGTFIGGWGIEGTQLYIGIARLFYPFFCGLLLSRIGRFKGVRGGFWWCSIVLALLLCAPRIGGEEGWMWNGVYETVCILLVFPLIVSVGAGSVVKGRLSSALCKFFGEISFPIYITHYPFVYMQMSWAAAHQDAQLSQHIMVAIGVYALSIFTAYAALRLYDEPVRNWLKEHWLRHKKVAK